MAIQKVPGRDIASETINGVNIKDGSITGADIANSTITLDKLVIPNNSIPGATIVDGTIADVKLQTKYMPKTGGVFTGPITVPAGSTGGINFPNDAYGGSGDTAGMRLISKSSEDTTLEIYVANDINDTVNISVPASSGLTVNSNVVWNAGNFNPDSKQNKLIEGICYQNYDLEGATTYVNPTGTTTALIQHFYLAYPLTINYLTYIITSGSSLYKSRVAIWESDCSLVWDSKDQSAASGTYKINVPSILLTPGHYYIAFMANYTSARFLSQSAPAYSVIPQRGTLSLGSWGNIPATLVPSNITMSSSKQPWFLISKY